MTNNRELMESLDGSTEPFDYRKAKDDVDFIVADLSRAYAILQAMEAALPTLQGDAREAAGFVEMARVHTGEALLLSGKARVLLMEANLP